MFQLTKNREIEYISLKNYICTLPEDCIIMRELSKDNTGGNLTPAKPIIFDS